MGIPVLTIPIPAMAFKNTFDFKWVKPFFNPNEAHKEYPIDNNVPSP